MPFRVCNNVVEQVHHDKKLDIIEKPQGPTPWVSGVVVVPKKDLKKKRVCVDMREANQTIKREWHGTPTLTDMVHTPNGAKVFGKLDLNQSCNQLELAPSPSTSQHSAHTWVCDSTRD